ncbi:MAG TPA: MFS transporter [Streptosporangiaceae bacterium]|nr:MFS transporter [Streptosporangiaceae bacterium]
MRAEIGRSPANVPVRGAGPGLLIAGILILAFNLRAAITSLPPIFPELHTSMQLSSAGQAFLAAIPVLCFGLFSGIAAPLSRASGEERVLGASLLLLVAGLVMRGAAPSTLLFPGTILAGGAIALMNVLLPSLVKRRQPDRAGLLIGLYLASMSTGAIMGSLIAVPVYQAAGSGTGAVRITLGLWAVPALVGAAAWLPQLRYRTAPPAGPLPEGEEALLAEPRRPAASDGKPGAPARPGARAALWRNPLTWQVTLFMGLQSAVYYASLSWFPTLFRDRGVSAVDAGTLVAVMNLGNAVAALLVPVLAYRLRTQQRLVAVTAAGLAAGLAGAAFAPVGTATAFALVLGLGQGAALGLAIFFTMARAPDPVTAASLSAFAQSVGYLLASLGPLLVGFLHTATGSWTGPVLLLLAVIVVLLASGWLAGRDQTVPAQIR